MVTSTLKITCEPVRPENMTIRLPDYLSTIARAVVLILLFSAGSSPLRAQLDRYLVLVPSLVVDGPTTGDRSIGTTGFTSDGAVEFLSSAPKPMSTPESREFAPVTSPDGAGGLYLLYTTEPSGAGPNANRDLVMRHVGSNGDDLWSDSGRVGLTIANSAQREQNPRIVPLEDGSLTIVYEVSYLAEGSDDIDLAAVRVSSDGRMLWAQPVWIARTNWRERLAGAVANGQGGVMAIYQISTRKDSSVFSDIKAVRIDSSSALGWKDSRDPVIVATSRHIESNPSVVSDRNGGAYISYEVEYTSGPRAGDVDILAQHLTSYGTRLWTSESRLPFVSSIDKARERNPSIAFDDKGLVVAFQIYYYGVRKPFYLIGIQRLDTSGHGLWNKGKTAETIDVPGRVVEAPQVIADPTGGVFLLFETKDTVASNRDVYVQKLDFGGVKMWGHQDWGIPIFNSSDVERDPAALPDGKGGIVVVGVREKLGADGSRTNEIIADRVAPDGNQPWKDLAPPIVLSISNNRGDRPLVVKSP